MESYETISDNMLERFKDLENEILKREREMDHTEAKLFHDHLISLYERLVAVELQIETYAGNSIRLENRLRKIRPYHLKVIDLKSKLARMFPSLAEIEVNNTSDQTKHTEIVSKLDSHIRKRDFVMSQFESLEIPNDLCAKKAKVLDKHFDRLNNSFLSNQLEIVASLDAHGDMFKNQQKIAAEFQQKVIDSQTKVKKSITRLSARSPNTTPIPVCSPAQSTMNNEAYPPSPTEPRMNDDYPLNYHPSPPSHPPSPPRRFSQEEHFEEVSARTKKRILRLMNPIDD